MEAQNLLTFKLGRTGDLKQFPASINLCLDYFTIKSELVFYADDKWNAKDRANHMLWARFDIFSHWRNYCLDVRGSSIKWIHLLAVAIIVFLLFKLWFLIKGDEVCHLVSVVWWVKEIYSFFSFVPCSLFIIWTVVAPLKK